MRPLSHLMLSLISLHPGAGRPVQAVHFPNPLAHKLIAAGGQFLRSRPGRGRAFASVADS